MTLIEEPPATAPDYPPTPAPPRRGKLFSWVSRKPRAAFFATLGASLFVGIAIGASGGVEQETLDQANARADRAATQVASLRSDLKRTQDLATKAQSRGDGLAAQVKRLSAQGEVPSLAGMDIDDARSQDAINSYNWRVRTVRRISTQSPGTVIAQSPAEGKVLKSGRSITLTVAEKAPPKPKQWVTIKTLSGASSTKSDEFTIPEGATARLVYDMPQDGNNAITLYQAPDEYVDLLLNEIGPQSGSTRVYQSGTYYLDVMGAYTINVQVFKRPTA
jgi:hypothetical protein